MDSRGTPVKQLNFGELETALWVYQPDMEWHHDKTHDVLLYPARFTPNPTYGLDSKYVGNGWFGVKRTLRHCQILRYLNFPVPPLITDENYDWPIRAGRKPLATQRLMANFSALHPRMFNLSDPGTMKTLSSLWAMDWLMRQHAPGTFRALIIGTLSTLETTWGKELFTNFLDSRTFEILHGAPQKRMALLDKPRDVYIINHDGVGVGAHTRKKLELDGFSKELANRKDIQLVIADEASAYKDAQTKRHRIARQVIGGKPYLWLLTGSPTPTAPTDAYGLAKMVNNAYGKSFTGFQAETMFKVSQFRWVPQKDGYEKAARLLSPTIRIPIEAVWDGPPLTFETRQVGLTAQQIALMKDLKNDLQVTLKSGEPISAINEAAARQKFLQISLGAVYDANHAVHMVDAEPRYSEVENIIGETTRKIVIFAGLTSVVDLLYKRLHKRWPVGVINGDVSQKDRAKVIRGFEGDGPLRIVVCDPQATAHGINEFVSADTAIWFTTSEKAELFDQGNKRIRRPGQLHPTRCVMLVSNPLEKEIFRRLENNLTLQGSLLELVRSGQL